MQATPVAATVAPTGPSQSAGVGGLLAEVDGKGAGDQAVTADASNPFAEALAAAMGIVQPVAIQATTPTTPTTTDATSQQVASGATATRFELAALAGQPAIPAAADAATTTAAASSVDQTAPASTGQTGLASDLLAALGQTTQPPAQAKTKDIGAKLATPEAAAPAKAAQPALAIAPVTQEAAAPALAPTPTSADAVAAATTIQAETAPTDQAQGLANAAGNAGSAGNATAQAVIARAQDRNQARADAKIAKADSKAKPVDATVDQPTAKAVAGAASLASAIDDVAQNETSPDLKTSERPADDAQLLKVDDKTGQSQPQILAADIRTQANALQTDVRANAQTVSHLAAQIVGKVAGKSTRFDVQLDPAGLGRVDVKIEIGARGELTAALSFDNPQAAAELRGRSGELQRALEQAGFDLSKGGLSFDMNGQSGGQNLFEQQADNRPTWRGRAFTDLSATADAPPPILSRSAQAGGVDVTI